MIQRQFEPCACERTHKPPRLTRLTNNKRLSSRGRLRAAAKRGPPLPLVSDRPSRTATRRHATAPATRRRRVQAVWDGTFDTTVSPNRRQRANRTRAGRGRLRKYAKQLKAATAARKDQSLPANGLFVVRAEMTVAVR